MEITGEFFGPISSNILVTIGGLSCTSVTWKSDTLLEMVTPPMSGSGGSQDMEVVLTAGNQSNDVPFDFTYAAPTLTGVDLVAQKVATSAAGVRLIIHGTEFANVTPIASGIQITATKGSTIVVCLNVARISYEELQCDYPNGGTEGLSGYNVEVTVAGQTSTNTKELVYCSDVKMVTKIGSTEAISANVEKGKSVSYTAQLNTPLAASTGTAVVKTSIAAGGEAHCTLTSPTSNVQVGHGDYATSFTVSVTTKDGEGDATKKCTVEHTIISEDPCFKMPAASFMKEFEITITNSRNTSTLLRGDDSDPNNDDTMVIILVVAGSAVGILAIVITLFFATRKNKNELLSKKEKEILRKTIIKKRKKSVAAWKVPGSGPKGSNRFTGDVKSLKTGKKEDAASVLAVYMKADEREVHHKMILGLQAIKDEIYALEEGSERPKWWDDAHPNCKTWMSVTQWYEYIVDDVTTEKEFHNGTRDKGNSGKYLRDFCNHPIAVECGLREEHIVALRLYTTHAYMFFNDPLRKNERHPMPVTVRFLQEGEFLSLFYNSSSFLFGQH